jgi:hypothetical protein
MDSMQPNQPRSVGLGGFTYCAHLLTMAFAFAIGSFFLTHLPGLRTLFEQYLKNPSAAIAASTLLVFQPPLMDILPMYILFSFLTPLVFWAAGRREWKTVILTSLSIWLISQLRVRDLLVTATKDLSYINPGPFDVLAWQLLWVSGLFCGQRLYEKKRTLPLQKPWPLLLILLSIGFFAWRLTTISANAVPTNQAWLFDKWHLGPLRLLNFMVTGWAISKVLGHLQRWETVLQHVACFLLGDWPINAPNRYNLNAQKRRAVFFYSRDLPIVDSILARSLL